MTIDARLSRILELVIDQGRVEVAELSDQLGVSQVTVRKDLDRLEARGLVARSHGYATVASADDLSGRLAYHYDIKTRIAAAAAQSVAEGEIVMIESGSCCALLADRLASTRRGVTIVTNSAFIAEFIRKSPYANVVLLGGNYQNESQVVVGPLTRAAAAGFHVSKLFIGIDGFTAAGGFTGKDHLRAETVQDMAASADSVIVLSESAKFTRQGVVPLLGPEHVRAVYTDDALSPSAREVLRQAGIALHTVAVKEAAVNRSRLN